MNNFCEFVDGDMTEEDRKKIDELLIKIAEENELHEKIGKLESENKRLREALEHATTTETTVDKWGIWRIDGKTFQTWAADVLKGGDK